MKYTRKNAEILAKGLEDEGWFIFDAVEQVCEACKSDVGGYSNGWLFCPYCSSKLEIETKYDDRKVVLDLIAKHVKRSMNAKV